MITTTLFWIILIGITIASLQDLKRREVDYWLNLTILLISTSYLFFTKIIETTNTTEYPILGIILYLTTFNKKSGLFAESEENDKSPTDKEYFTNLMTYAIPAFILALALLLYYEPTTSITINFTFSLLILYATALLFQGAKIFAGGDARLLFALSALFVTTNTLTTLSNIGVFLLFLMLSGSIYGLTWSFALYTQNYKKINKAIYGHAKRLWFKYIIFTGLLFITLSFFIPGLNWSLMILLRVFGFTILLFPPLFVFAKGLEDVSMTKTLPAKKVRLGDWLAKDTKIGKRTIKASFAGITQKELKAIHQAKKKITIKEGIPFVPAFLIAYLLYTLTRELILSLFFIY